MGDGWKFPQSTVEMTSSSPKGERRREEEITGTQAPNTGVCALYICHVHIYTGTCPYFIKDIYRNLPPSVPLLSHWPFCSHGDPQTPHTHTHSSVRCDPIPHTQTQEARHSSSSYTQVLLGAVTLVVFT